MNRIARMTENLRARRGCALAGFDADERRTLLAARSKIGNDLSVPETRLFCRYYAAIALRTGSHADQVMARAYRRRLARMQGGAS